MSGFLILTGFSSSSNMTADIYTGLPAETKWNFKHQVKVSEPYTILNAVAAVLNIDAKVITSTLRTKEVSEARCIAIALIIKANPNLFLREVGYIFNRHHATILHSRELFYDLNGRDKAFTEKVNKVRAIV